MVILSRLLSAVLAAPVLGTPSDSISMVQGRVYAHTHSSGSGASCSPANLEGEGRLDPSIADRSEVVVIRGAGEDVRWLDTLPEVPTLLYNRNGLPEQLPRARRNLKIEKQENIGGQEGAMLTHIIENYDKLPKYTVFLQGWPFWHCAGTTKEVRRALRDIESLSEDAVVNNGAEKGLVPMAATFYQYNLEGGWLGNWFNLVRNQRKKLHMSKEDAEKKASETYNTTCQLILGAPCPEKLWVSEGGQWAVSRERIRSRPLSFYQQLRDMEIPGDELAKKKLRGLVLEAVWPIIWGSPDWTPGQAVKAAGRTKDLTSFLSADALNGFCLFTTEPKAEGSPAARRSVCELDQHAEGVPSQTISLNAGRSNTVMRLQAVQHHQITKAMTLERTSDWSMIAEDAVQPSCSKRHIWPITAVTQLKNKGTGQCIDRVGNVFSMVECNDKSATQQLHLNANQNGGLHQIQDSTEEVCFAHNFAVSGSASKCKTNPEGAAPDDQKWEFVSQGNGVYQIKMKGGNNCITHSDFELRMAPCGQNAIGLWDLSNIAESAQYLERFEYGVVQLEDGSMTMRCTQRLHSEGSNLDVVEPTWRKKGRVAAFTMQDGDEPGSYFLVSGKSEDGSEQYLSCNRAKGEVVSGAEKTAWKFRPVSNSFVFLQAGRQHVLQFSGTKGLRCGIMSSDGVPPQDSTFSVEFSQA